MKLSQFKFKLPQDKIAQYPAPHRDECRMMVLHRKTGEIEHRMFKDLLTYFDENDLFVFNDTKVFPARLYEPEDLERFQCIFAKNEGAVTAPATGLHFSRELMKRMEIKGINFAYITLHCGMGCFRETDVEDLTKHKMDSEQMFVEQECCDIVNKTKEEEHKVVAVGTTVQRALEACVGTNARIKAFEGWTNKFIFPPYNFTVADAMLSNFHLPYSTMLMLTAAFGDYDYTMHAYNVALKEDYKFGPYGDVMLIID